MAFESLSNRWVAVAAFTWSAADPANTVLTEVYVTPGFGLGDSTRQYPTGAGLSGFLFNNFRADAEYSMVVPASTLHRGALQVLYIPNGGTLPSNLDNVTNVGQGALLDVAGPAVYEMGVGYATNRPMLPLTYFNSSWPILPVGDANGTIQVRVVNPLVSPNPVDSLRVVIFARFKNVQFSVPRAIVMWPDDEEVLRPKRWEQVELQGKVPGDDQSAPAVPVELIAPSGLYPVVDVVAGEDIRSMRALAQRPSQIDWTGIGSTWPSTVVIPPGGVAHFSDFSSGYRLTAAGIAMSPFIFAAASEKVKVIPTQEGYASFWSAKTDHPGYPIVEITTEPAAAPRTWMGPNRGAEFVIPHYFPHRGRNFRVTGDNPSLAAMRKVVAGRVENALGDRVPARVYYSLGDDLRVGPFTRFPVLRFS
jgi:hypothetical protein